MARINTTGMSLRVPPTRIGTTDMILKVPLARTAIGGVSFDSSLDKNWYW